MVRKLFWRISNWWNNVTHEVLLTRVICEMLNMTRRALQMADITFVKNGHPCYMVQLLNIDEKILAVIDISNLTSNGNGLIPLKCRINPDSQEAHLIAQVLDKISPNFLAEHGARLEILQEPPLPS